MTEPMDQPDESMPAVPSTRRSVPRWGWITAGAIVVAGVAVTIAVAASSSGSSDPFNGYHKDPEITGRALHTCVTMQRFGSDAVRCNLAGGAHGVISTSTNLEQQEFVIADDQDNNPTECDIALKGVLLVGDDEATLAAMLGGPPDEFARKHGGRVLCPVGSS